MTNEPRPTRPFALVALTLAALWLLTGAGFKLFLGTPNDLPGIVKDLPLGLGLTYQLTIAIELVFVVLALGAPRIGWIAITAIYVLFELILWSLTSSGADSCGCFGSKVTITPGRMMLYDGVLLGLLLLSQPWKGTGAGWNKRLVALLSVLAFALPFLYSREVKFHPPKSGEPAGVNDSTGATEASEPEPEPEPIEGGFTILAIEDWVGQLIYDTPLVELVEQDISMLPTEGLWIFWRADCDHCAAHLQELATNPPIDQPFLTLVQLKQSTDTDANRVVHILPSGPTVVEASLPDRLDYAIETPAELRLEGAMILSAEEGVGH